MPDDVPLGRGDTMHIYTDGASRGNPGEAACAYVYATEGDEIFDENMEYLGEATNNRAEYKAVSLALDDAVSVHRGPLILHSDSQLVVNQLNGDWRVKSDNLLPLYDEIMSILQRYDNYEFRYIPRENSLLAQADDLCNKLLDERMGKV